MDAFSSQLIRLHIRILVREGTYNGPKCFSFIRLVVKNGPKCC